jgi:hypothetical protein
MSDGYVLVMGDNVFYWDWKIMGWPKTVTLNHKNVAKNESPLSHTPKVDTGTYSAEVVRVEYSNPELKLLSQGREG